MKKLVLFFLIIGRISFGQNCALVSSSQALPYLISFESAIAELTNLVNKFQDSLEQKAINLERYCSHCKSDSIDYSALEKQNEELLQLEKLLYDSLEYLVDSLMVNVYNEYNEFLECFALENNLSILCDEDSLSLMSVEFDYTDEFIQYILCYYEANNIFYVSTTTEPLINEIHSESFKVQREKQNLKLHIIYRRLKRRYSSEL